MVENFEARNFYNYDANITLGADLKIRWHPFRMGKKRALCLPCADVYPMLEGRHACDTDSSAPITDVLNPSEAVNSYTQYPDPMGLKQNGYNYTLCNYHPTQRAYTLHNSNPVINELFKYGADGKHAFFDHNAVYADRSKINNGDLVLVETLISYYLIITMSGWKNRPDIV